MPILWVLEDNTRFIQWDESMVIPNNTKYITIKDLTIEEIEEIEKATFDKVQQILSNFI